MGLSLEQKGKFLDGSSISLGKNEVDENNGWVSPHGAQLPINEAGYVIHHTLHKLRPDVVAAAHRHGIYGKTWSVFGRPIDIMQQDACLFHGNLSVYANQFGVVLSDKEGENIAKALGPSNLTCIMQNHGLLTCGSPSMSRLDQTDTSFSLVGRTVDECVYLFALLEKTCQQQLQVEAAAATGCRRNSLIPKMLLTRKRITATGKRCTIMWVERRIQ